MSLIQGRAVAARHTIGERLRLPLFFGYPMDALTLFATFTVAIVLEAAPFLLAGALLSACIERFVKPELLQAVAPRSVPLQLLFGVGAGLLLPTCECGVVPVVRRLLHKGLAPAAAISYMLAAPVVNPVVLVSTYVAFQGDVSVVLMRVALVLAPALVLGTLAAQIPVRMLLRPEHQAEAHAACGHTGCGCGHEHGGLQPLQVRRHWLPQVLRHTAAEFTAMGAFLILGAMAAAAFKTFAPAQWLLVLESNAYLAVGAMMVLAIVLSVCSEADAFVAASFMGLPQSAQLAFMGIGPMVDLKLVAMFLAVFHRRFALALIVVPTVMVYVLCLAMAFGDAAAGAR